MRATTSTTTFVKYSIAWSTKTYRMPKSKLDEAQYILDDCKAFLADLPDDVTLEPVKAVKPNGADLHTVRRRIADAEEEIARLSAIPVPAPDIEGHIEEYVSALARPKVTGVATGQRLQVSWPNDARGGALCSPIK